MAGHGFFNRYLFTVSRSPCLDTAGLGHETSFYVQTRFFKSRLFLMNFFFHVFSIFFYLGLDTAKFGNSASSTCCDNKKIYASGEEQYLIFLAYDKIKCDAQKRKK